jgi:nitroreductase
MRELSEMLDLLKTRRSVPARLMEGPGPTATELEEMLAIATRVPDHGKLAPWRFVVFEGEARERAGALVERIFVDANPEADAERRIQERGRLSRAPLVVAVVSTAAAHPKIPEWEQILSAGAVCTLFMLAANAKGFATNWLTEWYAYDAKFRAGIGLVEHERIAGFIHVGRSAEKPADRPRPVVADLVTRF